MMAHSDIIDKLVSARCRLMAREPWYGHMAIGIEWICSDKLDTMGVRIVNGGQVQCLFSKTFVAERTLEELYATVMHEIEHLVRLHCIRNGDRHPELWNIAADMCVNGTESNPRIGYRDTKNNTLILPFDSVPAGPDGNKPKCVFIPDDWKDDRTSEEYYDKLFETAKTFKRKKGKCTCGNKGNEQGKGGSGKDKDKGQKGQGGEGQDGDQGEGQGQGQGSGEGEADPNCPQHGSGGAMVFGDHFGVIVDDHSVWNDSDVSPDEARQVVHEMVKEASEKSRGHTPGHLQQAINELAKPIVRWTEELRSFVGRHVGNRRGTWARQNRRRPEFGNRGHTLHAAATVGVIVDTSGSIGDKELSQFFSEIDAMAYKCKVSLLQWDYNFQGYTDRYRRGDWKKIKINGRGGTDMAAPVEWLCDNKLVPDVTVMLTDGYCNWAEEKQFPMITCITGSDGSVTPCPWGKNIWMGITN